VVSIVILAVCGVEIVLVRRFTAIQVCLRVEGVINLALLKYILPILGPIGISALPAAIYHVSEGSNTVLAVLVLILRLVSVIWQFLELHLISPRILFENSMAHEWHASHVVLQSAAVHALVTLSSALAFTTGAASAICIVLSLVIYALFGAYCFYFSPTVKRSCSVLFAAISFSGAIVSLIALIGQLAGGVNSILLLIILVILVGVFYVGLGGLDNRFLEPEIFLMDSLADQSDFDPSVIEATWTSPLRCMRGIQMISETWPPFLFGFKLCSWSLERWPHSHALCLLWCRLVSLFPREDALFRWLTTQYSWMEPQWLRTALIEEMIHLSGCRVSETTSRIRSGLRGIHREIRHCETLRAQFWRNILQKSIDSFWSDTDAIFRDVDRIEAEFNHLIDISPNNAELLGEYCDFLLAVKADGAAHAVMSAKLLRLEQGGVVRADLAVECGKDLLPQVAVEGEEARDEPAEVSPRREREAEGDAMRQQLRLSLQNLIERTRMASIAAPALCMAVGTVLAVSLFAVYTAYFTDCYCRELLAINGVGEAIIEVAYAFPLAGLRAATAYLDCFYHTQPIAPFAPRIAATGRLPDYKLGREELREAIALVRSGFELLTESIQVMDKPELLRAIFQGGQTPTSFEAAVIGTLMAVDELAQTTLIAPDPAYNFMYLLSTVYSDMRVQQQQIVSGMRDWFYPMIDYVGYNTSAHTYKMTLFMSLPIFVNLLLVATPMVLTSFGLSLKAEAVAAVFTSLPIAAIRDVVGQAETDTDNEGKKEDVAGSAILTPQPSHAGEYLVTLCAFLASIVVFFVGGFLVYLDYVNSLPLSPLDLGRIKATYLTTAGTTLAFYVASDVIGFQHVPPGYFTATLDPWQPWLPTLEDIALLHHLRNAVDDGGDSGGIDVRRSRRH
jgi:hypothetical protein